MAITVVEQIESRAVSARTADTRWIARTTAGETSTEVRAAVTSTAPSSLDGKPRVDTSVKPTTAPDLFFATCTYGTNPRTAPTPPENFRTSGVSFQYFDEKIFEGLEDDGWDGTIDEPETNKAIRLNKHNVPEGTTIKRAGIVRTEGYVITTMDNAYILDLHELAMCVNTTAMFGFPAGSVQFVDQNMTSRSDDHFNLSLRFLCLPPTKLTINDLNAGSEMTINPFWRFWSKTSTKTVTTGAVKTTAMTNLYAKQVQVYPEADLNNVFPDNSIIVS